MTALVVLPRQLVVDGSGDPRSGAKLYTYDAGTTTARTSYTTAALSTPHANPVVAVSTGLFPAIYVDPAGGDYKLVLKDSADVTIWTEDNIKAAVFEYDITAAESGVTVVSTQYPPGDVRRYGMTGSGDETSELLNAIEACAEGGYTLKGEPGKTYTLTGSSAIDISGVLNVDMRGCTIDASAMTATIVFYAEGTKTLAESGVTFANGADTIDVTGSGVTFARGNTILITSIEAHPNPARAEYFKGTRTYVDSQSGNNLRVYPPIDHAYTATAYVWKVTPNVIDWRGGTLLCNAAVDVCGLEFDFCEVTSDVEVKYASQAGIRFQNSRARYTGKMDYCYLTSSGTSYCVVVADLSDVDLVGCELVGARHAAALGGGTWLQTASGGSSGAAAYPGSLRINGGIYGSSLDDPSQEIGGIDCHGIGKRLLVSGATIYGGLQLAAIESCIVDSCNIHHRNYKIVGIADSESASWGHIQLTNNHCYFDGAFAPGATPAASPAFINAGSDQLGKRLTVRGNTFHADSATINATASLGLIRGFGYMDISNNKFSLTKSGVSIEVTMEVWVTNHLLMEGNRFENMTVYLRPIGLGTAVVEARGNISEGAGLSGLMWLANSLDATAYFREMHFESNLARNCYNCGIQGRSSIVKRLYLIDNRAIDCNVSGNATDYTASGIGIQKIDNNDILKVLVAQGNIAITDADAANAHKYGLYFSVSATLGTDVAVQNNISVGHSTAAMIDPASAGSVTILRNNGNSLQTLQAYTTGAHSTLRDFTGTSTAAHALQLLESVVDDLQDQGLLS